MSSTIWEIKSRPYITGVFVDIFPMDLSVKSPDLIKKEMKHYDRLLNLYLASIMSCSFRDILSFAFQKKLRFLLQGVLSFFVRFKSESFLNKLITMDNEHCSKYGDYFVLFSGCFIYRYEKEILRREWFDDYQTMLFEGLEVRVPIGYDDYLTHVYGNYMQLPPEEERVSRHYNYYIDLHKRLSIAEIININR